MPETIVIRSFSQAAGDYDSNARVQARVARDLLLYSQRNTPKTILEPGCGTGLYTRMLLDLFPEAVVDAIDISAAMIRVAQDRITSPRVSFLCADAETFAAGRYDMITSNASFHWFCDCAHTVERCHGMLGDGGALTFSYFGPDTYRQLQESIQYVTGSSAGLACNSFLTAEEIRSMLAGVFRTSSVEEREYEESFASLRDLLDNIKLTGTRGAGSNMGIIWTRGLLRSIEDAYLDRFGRIRASYQVYMCRAER